MSIPVMRCKRHKIMSDSTSPKLTYLRFVPGHSRTYTEEDIAKRMEVTSSISVEDVLHVMRGFKRELKSILQKGDKVKINGLGTFHLSFNCTGTEDEKECTVRNIRKVNIRFSVDNTLRLVNDSTAGTRGAANNVEFYIKGDTTVTDTNTDSSGGTGDDTGGGDSSGGFVDPTA